MLQGSVLGPLLFLLYIADLPGLHKNVLVGYADDSTLFGRIAHPSDRASAAASFNDDLLMISDWCTRPRYGMLVNPNTTKGMLISHSHTVEPLFPDLVIDGYVVEIVSELKILGVIFDSKLAFEKQVSAIVAFALRRVSILKKTMSVFKDVAVATVILPVLAVIWVVIFPLLECCSPVWISAATSHLLLLHRVVDRVRQLKQSKCQLLSLPLT